MTVGAWIITLFALGAVVVCLAAYVGSGWALFTGIAVVVGSLGLAAFTDVDDTDRTWPGRRQR